MIPAAGSTYSYTYAAFGVFLAWFIGWDLLLEYLFAASAVAVGWSGYAVSLLDSAGIHVPHSLANPPFGAGAGVVNLPAIVIVAAHDHPAGRRDAPVGTGKQHDGRDQDGRAAPLRGLRRLPRRTQNWHPFLPANTGHFGDFGVSGLLQGAGVVFFAYVGFDAVSTAAAEARDPQRTVPFGLMATVLISTVLYVAIGLVMTGMAHYTHLDVADPLSKAIQIGGGNGMEWLDDAHRRRGGDRARLDRPRDLLRPDADLHADVVGRDAPRRLRASQQAVQDAELRPRSSAESSAASSPGLTPIETLSDLVSIGTLFAFMLVCSGVMVLRHAVPTSSGPSACRTSTSSAPSASSSRCSLMVTLPSRPSSDWSIWLAIGLVIFFTYARSHTKERFAALEAEAAKMDAESPAESGAQPMLGAVGKRLLVSVGLAGLGALSVTATASALTLGSVAPPNLGGCTSCDVFQFQVAAGEPKYRVPAGLHRLLDDHVMERPGRRHGRRTGADSRLPADRLTMGQLKLVRQSALETIPAHGHPSYATSLDVHEGRPAGPRDPGLLVSAY